MSVQRRAFGDVKNTISGTPAAFRDQKGGQLPLDKNTNHSTPVTTKTSRNLNESIFSTPAASRAMKTTSIKTPFSVYSGSHDSTAKNSALRGREIVVSTTTAVDPVNRKKDGGDPSDSCTYLPLPETYEDLREDRQANKLYTLNEDDELSFNQHDLYKEFASADFDEDRFFEELLSNK